MSNLKEVQGLVWIACFTAAIAISAFIAFPIGVIPFTLQVLMIFLAALVLGSKRAFICILIYLLLGLIGFPIFSGGKSGLAALLSPTGGFLIGFLPMVLIAGLAKQKTIFVTFALMILALATLYICGAAWFMYSLNASLEKALYATVLPFVGFDCIKIVIAYTVSKILFAKNLVQL